MPYSLIMQRVLSKRTGDEKIQAQVQYILGRGMGGGRGKTWEASHQILPPVQRDDGNWLFKCRFNFEKKRGDRGGDAEYKQWEEIKAMIQQTGSVQRFQPFPWTLDTTARPAAEVPVVRPLVQQAVPTQPLDPDALAATPLPQPAEMTGLVSDITQDIITTLLGGVRTIGNFGPAKKWDQLIVPPELLGPNSDAALAAHPAWKNLYGVNPQIRIILSNIKRAQETNGESRNHGVLFGHAGCGKTTTMFALESMFGSDAVLKLDATSTTKAGLEKLFFSDLHEIPPLVFMEEGEKADPEALKIWLGALDDRGEIRKINFRVNMLRQVKVLFICSVNNKALFDKMMGSDGSEAGALSSRCVSQVYFPRPSQAVLFQILDKEIREKGGRHEWIAPAIALAEEMGVSDPRIVRSYLSGGDLLLDASYQRDWLANKEAQATFNRKAQ
jgi:hypothetical protein